MISIRVEPVNIAPVITALSRIPGGLERAIPRAVKRSLKSGRAEAGRRIAARYTIPARAVTSTIKVTSNAMVSRGSRISLQKFKHNPRRRVNPGPKGGIFAQVVRGQGGQLRRAFKQNSGGIYEREGRPRYPIRKLTGPSAPGMLGNEIVAPQILSKIEQRLGIELIQQANAVIGGYA